MATEAELKDIGDYICNSVLDAMVFTLSGNRENMAKAVNTIPELKEYYIRQVNEVLDNIRTKD